MTLSRLSIVGKYPYPTVRGINIVTVHPVWRSKPLGTLVSKVKIHMDSLINTFFAVPSSNQSRHSLHTRKGEGITRMCLNEMTWDHRDSNCQRSFYVREMPSNADLQGCRCSPNVLHSAGHTLPSICHIWCCS